MKDKLKILKGLDGDACKVGMDAPGSRERPHEHDELELNLVLSGEAQYKLADGRYELRRGSLLWLFPEQSHMLVDFSAGYSMWVLVFRQRAVRRLCLKAAPILAEPNPEGAFCRILKEEDARYLDSLYSQLASLKERAFAFNPGLSHALTVSWLAFERASGMAAESVIHPAVGRAADLLQSGMEEGKIGELAESSGLSPSRLSRLFNSQMGVSIPQFRNRRRLENFFRIMREGGAASVSEAAIRAGFGSYVQFHRVFRKMTGRPPSEWN